MDMLSKLKAMTLDDLLNVDLSKLKEDEVAYIESRLLRVANTRLNKLRKHKKLSMAKLSRKEKKGFKKFQKPKAKKGKKTKPVNVRNKRIKNVNAIRDFLNKKTSKVTEVDKQLERYIDVIRKTLGDSSLNITKTQAKRISRLMEKAKELNVNTGANKKMSGSPRLLALIVDIVKSSDYVTNDEAINIIETAITEGYESAQEQLNNLFEEDIEGVEIDYDEYDFNAFE